MKFNMVKFWKGLSLPYDEKYNGKNLSKIPYNFICYFAFHFKAILGFWMIHGSKKLRVIHTSMG
jgi:hypothetical protein